MFNIVLIEPEIPANTGNIARTCLAAGARLHLVKPLGFSLDEKALRRAGLDYWREADVAVWDSAAALEAAQPREARRFYLTTKASAPYTAARFAPGDWLYFGRETRGLPEPWLAAHPERCLRIPMPGQARSLNLAVSVGIVLYEAIRQTGEPAGD
jgi:tRNA (cytidine/uridine-2'-O-)-methyltransferase